MYSCVLQFLLLLLFIFHFFPFVIIYESLIDVVAFASFLSFLSFFFEIIYTVCKYNLQWELRDFRSFPDVDGTCNISQL